MWKHAPAAARPHLSRALEVYGELERSLSERPRELAAYLWDLPSLLDWNAAPRRAETQLLAEVAVQDERAIVALQAALMHMVDPPATARTRPRDSA
ncbi:MAG: hypothetical protein ABW321_31260 [Polyangiales bacterium]